MFKTRLFLISALSLSAMMMRAVDTVNVDILNDDEREMNIEAQNADRSFYFGSKIPSRSKVRIIKQVIKLHALQEQLFDGICNNSVSEIKQAIAAGANVNQAKEGKAPLAWALSLGRADAVVCLFENGAR